MLSLFSPGQARLLVEAAKSKGFTLIPTDQEREKEMLPPGILGFLSSPYLNAKDKSALLWGYSTIVLAQVRQPKDRYFYKTALKDAYGITDEYADRITEKIDTPDPITGWYDKVLDAARRGVNWLLLPESLEISQSDKFDTDGGYEMMLLGREVMELALRAQMNVGTLSSYLVNGSLMRTSVSLEAGDPVNADDLAEFIGDLYSATTANDYADRPELGGPLRKLLKGKVKALASTLSSKTANSAITSLAGAAVPGGGLALNAVGKSSRSSRKGRKMRRSDGLALTDSESPRNTGGIMGRIRETLFKRKPQQELPPGESEELNQYVQEKPIIQEHDDWMVGDGHEEGRDESPDNSWEDDE